MIHGSARSHPMQVSEFLDGESLNGKQAAIIFFLWLGFVLVAGFGLVFAL